MRFSTGMALALAALVTPAAADDAANAPRAWSAFYAGSADYGGAGGGLSATRYGISLGGDKEWDGGWLTGASVSLGQQHFTAPDSTGTSGDVFLGVYGRKTLWERGYVTASLMLGWHDIDYTRRATFFEEERGTVTSREIGGRLEAGWRWWLGDTYSAAPFFAIGGDTFRTPAFSETSISGTSYFAASYAPHDSAIAHTELGGRLGRNFSTGENTLWVEATAGWARELDDTPFAQTAFSGLGSAYAVTAILPARDTAVLGLNLQAQQTDGLSYGARFDSQLGGNTTVLSGIANIAWHF
jgi:uncharacterized protein with beta-barrel porin domain